MRFASLALLVVLAGCLPSADTGDGGSDNDASANVTDMITVDLTNVDYAGYLNCAALDKAEAKCLATNATCVEQLRMMATPAAIEKDTALQQCFHQYCPLNGICMPDSNGMYTPACLQCVNNTLQATGSACTPASAPECTLCYNQGQACLMDM